MTPYMQLDGDVLKWGLAEKWTLSPEGAEEQMVRNGGAQKKHTLTQNTVKDICIEAETVQESLWKFLQVLQRY